MGLIKNLFSRIRKGRGQRDRNPLKDRRGMVQHTREEFVSLEPDDVLHVLMLHEANHASPGYEEHLLSYLLPKLSQAGFRRIDSIWGVKPQSPAEAQRVLERFGYDDLNVFAIYHEFADADEGVTAIFVVTQAMVAGKPVIKMPEG